MKRFVIVSEENNWCHYGKHKNIDEAIKDFKEEFEDGRCPVCCDKDVKHIAFKIIEEKEFRY